ncbi:hypothetical protein Forpe1208_v010946 [Fusarium oxysporum f. sp. rapae]|uniref:Uncharacterized protein n=1 Tax=Fusarium oxysporum f. sp. rapae TaxID=485398 RepID=A0A8J5NV07_FUSOX|nr:hypothetical protein Forpe1208_v010946 [Fusarium oxysporum f. sp. rapae]
MSWNTLNPAVVHRRLLLPSSTERISKPMMCRFHLYTSRKTFIRNRLSQRRQDSDLPGPPAATTRVSGQVVDSRWFP